ncbi:MAG: hypothetical protein IT452_07760 [Planctomycetia bacterium]|nr:hypothetical protein [Planctomycetia bacterium]
MKLPVLLNFILPLAIACAEAAAETVSIPIQDLEIPVPAGFAPAADTLPGAPGTRFRPSGVAGEPSDELCIVAVVSEPRCEGQPWEAGRAFAGEPAPPGGRRNWPDRMSSFWQSVVSVDFRQEARFAALLPAGGLSVGVFLRGAASRQPALLRDFEAIINLEGEPGAEKVRFAIPPVAFVVPEGFVRAGGATGDVLGVWRCLEGMPVELRLRVLEASDGPGWCPPWDLEMTERPTDSAVYSGWFDGRQRGFEATEKAGNPPLTASAVFLPVRGKAVEVQVVATGRQWITIWADAKGLQVNVRPPPSGGVMVAICGGCLPDAPLAETVDWVALRLWAALAVFLSALTWLSWRSLAPIGAPKSR